MVTEAFSVSYGTLRLQDLFPAYIAALKELGSASDRRVAEMAGAATQARDFNFDSDDAFNLLDTLAQRLETLAGPGLYFGAHFGDGADFGFWPCEDD